MQPALLQSGSAPGLRPLTSEAPEVSLDGFANLDRQVGPGLLVDEHLLLQPPVHVVLVNPALRDGG